LESEEGEIKIIRAREGRNHYDGGRVQVDREKDINVVTAIMCAGVKKKFRWKKRKYVKRGNKDKSGGGTTWKTRWTLGKREGKAD